MKPSRSPSIVGGLIAGAVVFYAAVVEYVAADLRAPLDFHFAGFDFGLLLKAVVHLLLVEYGAQVAQGVLAVFGLVAGLGVLDKDFLFFAGVGVGVLIAQAHAGFHLIDVLAASAAGAEGIPRHEGRFDLHLDGVVDQRGDEYGGERGHALSLGVVGRHAHQAVHSVLALEVAVGEVALDVDGAALYAGFVAFEEVGDGGFVAVFLAVAQIHAHEHGGPVLALGASGAGVDF